MKKFSELVVGDMLYIYYAELGKEKVIETFGSNFLEREINKIEKIKNSIKIYTNFSEFLISIEVDNCFLITQIKDEIVEEAIATSMDKLLLEVGEE